MEPLADNNDLTKPVIYLIEFVIALVCLYLIVFTVDKALTTGVLKVVSSNPSAVLSISQNNTQAEVIGLGKADVRLKPGYYLVNSDANGKNSAVVVQISKKQTRNLTLNPDSVAPLPTVQGVNFVNTSALVYRGLTTTQIGLLENYFFKYKTSAKTVFINPGSVYPEAIDPNSVFYNVKFSVKIDSTNLNAVISYEGLSDLRLYLYSQQTGSLVFDSGSSTANAE